MYAQLTLLFFGLRHCTCPTASCIVYSLGVGTCVSSIVSFDVSFSITWSVVLVEVQEVPVANPG